MDDSVKDSLGHLIFRVNRTAGTVRDIEGRITSFDYGQLTGQITDRISGRIIGEVSPGGIFREMPSVWKP